MHNAGDAQGAEGADAADAAEAADAEIARLNKIITALMNRAERSAGMQGSDFNLFHTAVTLEDQISQRTRELEAVLAEKELVAQALRDSEMRFRHLTDLSSDWYWEQDEQFRFTMISSGIQRHGGIDPDRYLGKTRWELEKNIPPEALEIHRALLEANLSFSDFEYQVQFNDGSMQWISVSGEPIFDQVGNFRGYRGTGKYITERKRTELLRSEQGKVLEMIASGSPLEPVFKHLMGLVESQLEGVMASIFLLDRDGEHLQLAAAPGLPAELAAQIKDVPVAPQTCSCGRAAFFGKTVVTADILCDPAWEDFLGLFIPHGLRSCWSAPIFSHQSKLLGVLAVYSREVRSPTTHEMQLLDMATHIAGIAIERREAEQRIRHMAHHDALTGLPNRSLLEDRLKQALAYAQRYGRQTTIAFVDLDNFKLINDSLGHKAGDEVLKTMAARMHQCVRATDTVVRLGGDEFIIILFDQPGNAEAISTTLEKISQTIAEPMYVGAKKLQITSSMGLASYPGDGADIDTLLMNADAAMYRAKELGRNNYQFYKAEMNHKVHEKLAMQEGLRHALAHDEFELLYQPQLSLVDGRIFGVEALLRWHHPELGLVLPERFIPLAEESGLIVPIGDWVLNTACRQNKAWQDAGMAPVTVAVNMSARQFRDKDLVERVARALATSGLAPRYLEIELTESLIVQDLQLAIETMKALQEMGVLIAIDDFGTGYSSLSTLKSFPIVRLKIDQTFIHDLADHADDQAITMAMISLAHKLNLKVIAEGVETDSQLDFLRKNDCDEIQGFHFSKPLAAGELAGLLRAEAK